MVALIDADSLLYKVGFAIEEKTIWNENEVDAGLEDEYDITYDTNLSVGIGTLESYINNILFATGCDSAELHFTGRNNFRDSNPLGYKEHRTGARKPEGFALLKQFALDNYDSYVSENMEADDVVVWKKTTYPEDYILCAMDKDVLYQTVGVHYNYNKDEDVEVDEINAIKFAYWQTLAGDPSDGYKGCPGIGPKKADKLLENIDDELQMWEVTLEAYAKAGLTEDDAINTMRLANMHQYDGKEITLWKPPK